jgi:nicotinamide-nucleotide amidase
VVDLLASVPEGAGILPNRVGAAAGLVIEQAGVRIFVMPGVPREMEAVFADEILPILRRLPRPEITLTRVLKTTGMSESSITRRLKPVIERIEAGLGYLPRPEGVELRITAGGARDRVERVLSESTGIIVETLGERVYSTEGEDIHFVTGRMLIESGLTIAVAESCTGGLIGHLLTEVPGISAVLDRAVVSYSNQAKIDTLGVPAALIEKHGAVSAEVAEAMALGVRERAGTDLGLSTTGIAGPGGGSEEKPVGLVYFGLASPGLEGLRLAAADAEAAGAVADAGAADSGGDSRAETVRMVFRGSRSVIKLKAAVHGLDLVRCRLLGIQGEAGA